MGLAELGAVIVRGTARGDDAWDERAAVSMASVRKIVCPSAPDAVAGLSIGREEIEGGIESEQSQKNFSRACITRNGQRGENNWLMLGRGIVLIACWDYPR